MALYSREFVHPPLDGSVTLTEVIGFHWKHNSDLPAFAYHEDDAPEVTEISMLEFGRAAHRVSHRIRPKREGKDGEVIAFIALADSLLYQAITIGMMIAGKVPFPISPRNTPAAIVNLLKKTDCHHLVTTRVTLDVLVGGIQSELAANEPGFNLTIEEIPALNEIFPNPGHESPEDPFEPYPPPLQRPPLSDIALYLHSSGSTGFPKAIGQSHEMLVQWGAFPSNVGFRDQRPRNRIAGMHLPPFHTLGIYTQVIFPLFGCCIIGMYPPIVKKAHMLPMNTTPDNILEHIRRTKSNALMTIPSLLALWAQDGESVEVLKSLNWVGYSGGAVVPKLGNFLVENGVTLIPIYGGTEFGAPSLTIKRKGDEKDWDYMEFSERSKRRWVPQGDGTYELQFLTNETHNLAIENLSDVKGYSTSDLWERHPTKNYLWKIVGRVDDVIIHTSGEKTVPAPIEDIIMHSPIVSSAILFGKAHNQPGVLIEPTAGNVINVDDITQLKEFRNKIWPIIEEANKVAPSFSRLYKEMIIVTSGAKPLPRTGKGTVMRKLALQMYHQEIEDLYSTIESTVKGESVLPPKAWNKDDIEAWLLEQVEDINPGMTISPSADIFEQGFDSLSSTILRRRISSALQSSDDEKVKSAATAINSTTIYTYPKLNDLSTFLANLINNPLNSSGAVSRSEIIDGVIEKYSAGLEGKLAKFSTSTSIASKSVILLTGSTGNLGAQLLEILLSNGNVEKVYAINRASRDARSVMERHRERFEDKGLDKSLLTSGKLIFVEADTSTERLGLLQETFDEIRNSVTHIIHNAWRLDFNLSLASFEANVRGTRNLIDLGLSSHNASRVRFLFTSSVSSASGWDQSKGAYPEEVVEDSSSAVGGGYGESKYVAERILAKSGLHATSLRIGQVTGGIPNGSWATSDWVPILVKSSVELGALPLATGIVSWLPMHAVAHVLLDIAFSPEPTPMAINLVHPRPTEWSRLIAAVGESIVHVNSQVRAMSKIPFQDWFDRLNERAKNATEEDQKTVPAIKLLDFFRAIAEADILLAQANHHESEVGGLPSFSTEKAQRISSTMAKMPPINDTDVAMWVKYWSNVGLFN